MKNPFGPGNCGEGSEEDFIEKLVSDEVNKGIEKKEKKDLASHYKVKSNRPDREQIIQKVEITNFKIAIENAKTIDEILAVIV
jgi:hypothetical protein